MVLFFAPLAVAHDASAESPLTKTARALAHDLGVAPSGAYVVAAPLTSDVPAPRAAELTSRVASLVAAALARDARAADGPLPLAAARARAHAQTRGSASALVYLDVRVANGELLLTADLYLSVGNAWDRVRSAAPPPSVHAFVHSPVEAEVRAYLAPVRLERSTVTRFAHDAGTVLALACGDLDGDGGNDLVLVTGREVAWGHLEGKRFVAVARVPAASVGRRSPVPFREPIAFAVLAASRPAALYVGWGDRVGAVLDQSLARRASIVGLPVKSGADVACVGPDAARGGFETRLFACEDGAPQAVPTDRSRRPSPALADAYVAAEVGEAPPAHVVLTHEPLGTAHLFRDGSDALSHEDLPDVGSQLALADLDQDGSLEVVTTTASRTRTDEAKGAGAGAGVVAGAGALGPAAADALQIVSWEKKGLVVRFRTVAPAGVDAVAVCPPEEGDAPRVVAAVGGEIWIVH